MYINLIRSSAVISSSVTFTWSAVSAICHHSLRVPYWQSPSMLYKRTRVCECRTVATGLHCKVLTLLGRTSLGKENRARTRVDNRGGTCCCSWLQALLTVCFQRRCAFCTSRWLSSSYAILNWEKEMAEAFIWWHITRWSCSGFTWEHMLEAIALDGAQSKGVDETAASCLPLVSTCSAVGAAVSHSAPHNTLPRPDSCRPRDGSNAASQPHSSPSTESRLLLRPLSLPGSLTPSVRGHFPAL